MAEPAKKNAKAARWFEKGATMASGWRLAIVTAFVLGFSQQASAECFQLPQQFLRLDYVNGDLGIGLSPTETWVLKMGCRTLDAKQIEWPQDRKICPGTSLKVDGQDCTVETVARK